MLDYVDGIKSPVRSLRDCLLFYPDTPVKELGPYAIRSVARHPPAMLKVYVTVEVWAVQGPRVPPGKSPV